MKPEQLSPSLTDRLMKIVKAGGGELRVLILGSENYKQLISEMKPIHGGVHIYKKVIELPAHFLGLPIIIDEKDPYAIDVK